MLVHFHELDARGVVATSFRRRIRQAGQLVLRRELERFGIDAKAQARRPRAVVENVAQVAVAAAAQNLCAHAIAVSLLSDVLVGDGLEKARPAGAGIEFGIGSEQR